jgi:hypothetical protein
LRFIGAIFNGSLEDWFDEKETKSSSAQSGKKPRARSCVGCQYIRKVRQFRSVITFPRSPGQMYIPLLIVTLPVLSLAIRIGAK